MPLTGWPLIALAMSGSVSAVAATVWVWNRGRPLRFALRTAGVLLTEALVLLSAGLVVNRSEQFYPSWAALFDAGDTGIPAYQTVAGRLDGQLADQAGRSEDGPRLLPWQPAGWDGWRLARAPTVAIPAGYLRHPQWRYSVVLVVTEPAAGWPGPAGMTVAAGVSRDVLVFVTTTARTPVEALASGLPGDLRHDLRVTAHRWALVTSPAEAGLARRAVLAAPAQYPAVATVQAALLPAIPAPALADRVPPDGPPAGNGRDDTAGLPAGIESRTVGAGAALAALCTAVRWSAAQTPPPLAASSPPVGSLPLPRSQPSRARTVPGRETPHVRSSGKGGTDGARQSRH